MSKKRTAKYTLWTINKTNWSQPLSKVKLNEEEKEELINIAKNIDETKLKERLRPFETLVTQDTLSKSVGQK